MRKDHLRPHPDSLVPLIFANAHRKYAEKLRSMLQTTEDDEDKDLDLNRVIDLFLKAAKKRDKVIPSLNAALSRCSVGSNPTRPCPTHRTPPSEGPEGRWARRGGSCG